MPVKFHEIPSMGLQDIKETNRYGRMHGRTHGRTDGRTDELPVLSVSLAKFLYHYHRNIYTRTALSDFECLSGSEHLM